MAKTDTKSEQKFHFTAPEAKVVQLVGDFTHWQRSPINMTRQRDGTWAATVVLAPGGYHYRFLVDGEWQDDPDCTLRVANPYGSNDMVREVVAHAAPVKTNEPARTLPGPGK